MNESEIIVVSVVVLVALAVIIDTIRLHLTSPPQNVTIVPPTSTPTVPVPVVDTGIQAEASELTTDAFGSAELGKDNLG